MANFRVGQKVICVDADKWPSLTVGAVYTVSRTGNHPASGRPVIWTQESRSDLFLGMDYGFYQNRFRPVHTIESDSEMFRIISEDSLGRLEAYEELLSEQFYVDESHE